MAEHLETISHDLINRYLRREKLTPRLLWENVEPLIQVHESGYIIFDDTVLDKRYSEEIALTRKQYSGNEHRVLKGIGLVNCIYVNPQTQNFWVIDYRIYAPDGDGLSKLAHVEDMLQNLFYYKGLPFSTGLMDSWYATKKLRQYIDKIGKIYYGPFKRNRWVDDTGGLEDYQPVESLTWKQVDLESGKIIKIKTFPQNQKVKLFRVIISTDKPEYIATNDLSQESTDDTQQVCAIRWKIEEFHREIKQITGIESCQCRPGRIQRNHIACAMLVWLRLKDLAYKTGQTIYQLKHRFLSNYLIQQLKSPTISITYGLT